MRWVFKKYYSHLLQYFFHLCVLCVTAKCRWFENCDSGGCLMCKEDKWLHLGLFTMKHVLFCITIHMKLVSRRMQISQYMYAKELLNSQNFEILTLHIIYRCKQTVMYKNVTTSLINQNKIIKILSCLRFVDQLNLQVTV